MSILFQILFPYRLLQNIEYSPLCYTVGPCFLSILYTVVCICNPKLLIYLSPGPPWKPSLLICEVGLFSEFGDQVRWRCSWSLVSSRRELFWFHHLAVAQGGGSVSAAGLRKLSSALARTGERNRQAYLTALSGPCGDSARRGASRRASELHPGPFFRVVYKQCPTKVGLVVELSGSRELGPVASS